MLIWSAGWAVVGGFLKARHKHHLWALALIALPFLLVIGIDLLNEVRRLVWLRGFDRVATFRKLRPKMVAHPEEFRFDFVTYSGFDAMRLRPAIVVDHIKADERIVIYPGSWKVVKRLRDLGIAEREKMKSEPAAGGNSR